MGYRGGLLINRGGRGEGWVHVHENTFSLFVAMHTCTLYVHICITVTFMR